MVFKNARFHYFHQHLDGLGKESDIKNSCCFLYPGHYRKNYRDFIWQATENEFLILKQHYN